MKEKLLLYTSTGFPKGRAAENFINNVVEGLHKNGVDVQIVLTRGNTATNKNFSDPRVKNLLFKRRPENDLFKVLETILISFVLPVSIIRNKIKYNHSHILIYNIDFLYHFLPIVITCNLLRIKLFTILTDVYDKGNIAPKWWKLPKAFFYYIQFKFYRYLDGIVCLSSYLINFLAEAGVKRHKLCLINHFVNIDKFSINSAENNSKHYKVAYCGSIWLHNGITDLIEAFNEVIKVYPTAELCIIGDGEFDIVEYIRKNYNSLSKNIRLYGNVDHSKLPELLSQMDILVNPRKSGRIANAGFPTKLGEYFALKKPVVTTAVGDIANLFTNKQELVLSEPNNPISIAEGIMFLINNKEIAKQIAEKGFSWAKLNIDYKSSALRLLNFIKSK